MKHLVVVAALVALSGPLAADSPFCVRPIGGTHVPAFAGSRPSELQRQVDCLAWEATVQPRAELLPAPEPRLVVALAVTMREHAPTARPSARLLPDPGLPAFGLGAPAEVFGAPLNSVEHEPSLP